MPSGSASGISAARGSVSAPRPPMKSQRRPAGDAAHQVVAGHVEQALRDLAPRDVRVHARAEPLHVEGARAEHVAREAVRDGVDHLRRRDARLGQPDEGLADALRAVLGA